MKFNILIVEDEVLLAQRIERFILETEQIEVGRLTIKSNLPLAKEFLKQHTIDVLVLDLNLHGQDGFELLTSAISESFQTIIISAYREKALEAFEYGVLDFIPKPFQKDRVEKALNRLINHASRAEFPVKYLAVKKNQKLELIRVDQVVFLKGAGNYTELHLTTNKMELHDKSLQRILALLPPNYERVHKSYIVNLDLVASISYKHEILLTNQIKIPISRSKYQSLKDRLT